MIYVPSLLTSYVSLCEEHENKVIIYSAEAPRKIPLQCYLMANISRVLDILCPDVIDIKVM